MATIKSYSDIEQSKKLTEILSLESADMKWFSWKQESDSPLVPTFGYDKETAEFYKDTAAVYLPCWSLAALLDVLPFHIIANNQRYAFSMHKGLNKDGETYMVRYNVFNTDICLYKTEYYNNLIDACYEMIIKLHELKSYDYEK
jgi:hypothetical protein